MSDTASDATEQEYGYDPTLPEPIEVTRPSRLVELPASAAVNPKYLPPVGRQVVPSCAAWASTYGLATFTAALAGKYEPNTPDLQASPAYIYIQVMKKQRVADDRCNGSQLMSYFSLLAHGHDGTATMEKAPYTPPCKTLWSNYGSADPPLDSAFAIGPPKAVAAKTRPDDVKQILFSGRALAYGTSLDTNFPRYRGTPLLYKGNGIIMKTSKGRPVGHCMLIVGYDDTMGAFYIQNSFGPGWGADGFVWMAYDTFARLAQGPAFYVGD